MADGRTNGVGVGVGVGVLVAAGEGVSLPSRLARADWAPRLKLVPMSATTSITATPANTTRLGRGSGMMPRRNGSSISNQLKLATSTETAPRAKPWAGEMVDSGPTSQSPPRIKIGQCHK